MSLRVFICLLFFKFSAATLFWLGYLTFRKRATAVRMTVREEGADECILSYIPDPSGPAVLQESDAKREGTRREQGGVFAHESHLESSTSL